MRKHAIKHARLTRLSAWALCQARQEAALLSPTGAELGLCLNACVLARSFQRRGRALFASGEEVLRTLTPEEVYAYIQRYLGRFTDTAMVVCTNTSFDEARYEELKRQ